MTGALRALAVLAIGVAVGGCQSARLSDLAPSDTDRSAGTTRSTASGAFPNLNVVPTPQTTQLSDAERSAKAAELAAALQRQGAAGLGGPSDTASNLTKLGATHGDAALKEIEGE